MRIPQSYLLGLIVVAAMLAVLPSSSYAGTILDLTGTTTQGQIGGAIFQRTDDQSTGTGVIDAFLSIQKNGTESGFNTDSKSKNWVAPYDDMKRTGDTGPNGFTRSLLLTEVAAFNEDFGYGAGTQSYRLFLLDVNEVINARDRYISLDDVQIWLGPSKDPATITDVTSGNFPVYKFSSGDQVLLDASINDGSGSGDMFLWVPDSLFNGADAEDVQLYLVSTFGSKGISGDRDYGTSDGFEEWAVLKGGSSPPQFIPEPTTILLLGTGLIAIGAFARKRHGK